MSDFKDKKVLITGGASGIGLVDGQNGPSKWRRRTDYMGH
jgi:hypothetical protein